MSPLPTLTDSQKDSLEDLATSLKESSGLLRALLSPSVPDLGISARDRRVVGARTTIQRQAEGGLDFQIARLKEPRCPNAWMLDAGRGWGKTTLLVALLDRMRDNDKLPRVAVLPPVDLSLAPAEFPVGVAALIGIHRAIREESGGDAPSADCRDAFAGAARAAFRSAKGFEKLLRGVAVSADHYARVAVQEASHRFELHRLVAWWLRLEALERGVDQFLVALDDADLAPHNSHGPLIGSLVDELHQPRLMVLVGCDGVRLRDQCTEWLGGDEPTARGLLNKVFPHRHHVRLQEWPEVDVLAFRPPRAPEGMDKPDLRSVAASAAAAIATLHGGSADERRAYQSVLTYHLPALCPRNPRGVEATYAALHVARRESQTLTAIAAAAASRVADVLPSCTLATLGARLRWGSPRPDRRAERPWSTLARTDGQESLPYLDGELPDSEIVLSSRWTEAAVDAALAERVLSPAVLIGRVPLLADRWRGFSTGLVYPAEALGTLTFRKASRIAPAWYWTQPAGDPLPEHANLEIGPGPLRALLAGERPWHSVEIHRYVRRAPTTSTHPATVSASILPCGLRALVRLTAALDAVRWEMLTRVNRNIDVLNVTRLAAAMFASAYVRTIGETSVNTDVLMVLGADATHPGTRLYHAQSDEVATWFATTAATIESVAAAKAPDGYVSGAVHTALRELVASVAWTSLKPG